VSVCERVRVFLVHGGVSLVLSANSPRLLSRAFTAKQVLAREERVSLTATLNA